jgi:DNA-binding transcriptional ArsR family regulator
MAPGRTKPQPLTAEQFEATPAELKALAHPLRLRILRLCLHEALTNKEFAERLGLDPATTLHHVRTLVRGGFIEPQAERIGARGALEKPYRATNKSWVLSIPRSGDRFTAVVASIDAMRAELLVAGPDALLTNTRLGLQLSNDEITELIARLTTIAHEYAQRPPTPGGTRVGLSTLLHRLA